jgi:chromosome segregation ATPase
VRILLNYEYAQARAERLEEQVKDLNEARKARQMYEDRMRVMEEQRDKAGEERRAQKKRLEELEAQIASMGDVGDQLAQVRPSFYLCGNPCQTTAPSTA